MAPEDRFCDLVMKGGITSGIVYPRAIAELASQYRFKNIGGTSAGAIAAVVTAAAEYQRRQTGKLDGFAVLAALPDSLGAPDGRGQTQLLRLFQPDKPGRRLFSVLVASLNRTGTGSRIVAILLGFLRAYLLATLVAIAVSILVALQDPLAGILLLIIAVPAAVGCCVYRDFTRGVVRNNYGLCKGLTTDEQKGPALTPWLHALIQRAAGLPAAAAPLTFGQLWRADGFPVDSLGPFSVEDKARIHSIDLQMFTTNVVHGRPYLLPHFEPTARLFYNAAELRQYLPADVMQSFEKSSRPYQPNAEFPESDPPVSEAERMGLREIPAAEDFPVVLAARMSLSFPVLFATVPLYAIDYERPRGQRTFGRCFFSDGGLSSNFPMHLFDAFLPLWPTFGIQLEAKLPDRSNMVFLPQSYREGFADHWNRFDEAKNSASRMGGFIVGLFQATQNWNDNVLSRMPGVRDRVVRVRLNDDEGGINLNMPADTIATVSARGRDAAVKLIERFIGPTPPSQGWDDQRWARLDVLIHTLGQRAPGLARALRDVLPHATPYRDLLERSATQAPPGHDEQLTPQEATALRALIEALRDLSAAFETRSPQYPTSPAPEAELRVRPSL